MKCSGWLTANGAHAEVTASAVIETVEESVTRPAQADWLAPGFIDLQVNGYAGVDYNSPAAPQEEIARSLEAQFAAGVTRLFPTVITGSPENILGSLKNLARARAGLRHGAALEAFHVEGPHIAPEDGPRGAHPREWVRPPDIAEFRRWQEAAEGNVRLVTLSPHWPGAAKYIETLAGEGVVVAIGHTTATGEEIETAVRAGATLSTHLGNGAHGQLARHPNYIWDQMAEDRLAASLIVDGIHLGASFLKVALRAKGVERAVLITDAVMPSGCAPGPYQIGDVDVELLPDQRVVLRGGDRLAGSSLRMDRGVENLMRLAGLTLEEAVTMATRNPARVGRIGGRQRGLAPGDRADVVKFRYDAEARQITVLETWLAGECVYRA